MELFLYIPFWIYYNDRRLINGYNTITVFTLHSGYIPMFNRVKAIQSNLTLHSILDIFQFEYATAISY